MSKFSKFMTEAKAEKTISQSQIDKLSKAVRKAIPTVPGDKYDDPDQFLTKLIDTIEELGDVTVDELDVQKTRNRFNNKRSDIYIDVDSGQFGISFKDNNTGKIGFLNGSFYNDPGKNHNSRYEMIYHF